VQLQTACVLYVQLFSQTIQEVLHEIRDPKSRAFLETLPYSFDIRSPSDESMKFVANFAKKSGDFAALSLTDLKLISLAHTLEISINGGKYLKTEINVS
jgi:RNA-binding protein NOB1